MTLLLFGGPSPSKTQGSKKTISIARELLERLRLWKQCSQFRADTDWVFASPMKIGRLPYSYTGVRQTLQRAADAAGIGKQTTHPFRHSFRTWLNQTGASIATQQKLMRHSSLALLLKECSLSYHLTDHKVRKLLKRWWAL